MEVPRNFESVPCLLCGNEHTKLLASVGQHGLPCYVTICPNDGLVFLNPRWTKDQYMHFYMHEYDFYYRPQVLDKETEEYKYGKIKEICVRLEEANLLKNRSSVFDIGSGMGWSLDWLKKKYPQFHSFFAIEPSEACIKNLAQLGVELVARDIDNDWQIPPVDLVIMRHVLEHLMNPIAVLEKIRNSLSDAGVVYIAVPDMMHPKKSLSKHCFRAVHTYYFSKYTLSKVAQKGGLHLISLQSYGSELWGVFRKLKPGDVVHHAEGTYAQQLNVIKQHQFKDALLFFKTPFETMFSLARSLKRKLVR